jgi:hypothetical protein
MTPPEGTVELIYRHGTEPLTLVLLIAAAFVALIGITCK